eukprot:m.124749 g.124749  ORF g.124749 m.124749 type:complete len:247 (-) comp13782_c0_seq1:191-931(-)
MASSTAATTETQAVDDILRCPDAFSDEACVVLCFENQKRIVWDSDTRACLPLSSSIGASVDYQPTHWNTTSTIANVDISSTRLSQVTTVAHNQDDLVPQTSNHTVVAGASVASIMLLALLVYVLHRLCRRACSSSRDGQSGCCWCCQLNGHKHSPPRRRVSHQQLARVGASDRFDTLPRLVPMPSLTQFTPGNYQIHIPVSPMSKASFSSDGADDPLTEAKPLSAIPHSSHPATTTAELKQRDMEE